MLLIVGAHLGCCVVDDAKEEGRSQDVRVMGP